MGTVPVSYLWPYDELRIEGDCSSGNFVFATPWVSLEVSVHPDDLNRAKPVLAKLAEGSVGPEDLAEVSWLLASVSHKVPISYILPRQVFEEELDEHSSFGNALNAETPGALLHSLESRNRGSTHQSPDYLPKEWKWDAEAALQFSAVNSDQLCGHDPLSLFSVARRFHLLESVENSKTAQIYQWVRSLPKNSQQYLSACSEIVRQNHYVTERCNSVLRPALKTAMSAQPEVLKFIKAEAGHDVLLARALKSLGISDPNAIPVSRSIKALMDLFKWAAETNFLGFCMIVDIFERSSYEDHDPLATLLREGGFDQAAKQIDLHREINDSGEHENVALGFMAHMAPVSSPYAVEALRLAELATTLTHSMLVEIHEELQKKCA